MKKRQQNHKIIFAALISGILFVFIPNTYALRTIPDVIEIGDKISFSIPAQNDAGNETDLENVRILISSQPAWLTLLGSSVKGPVTLPPGEGMSFRLDFEVTDVPEQGRRKIVAEIKTDTGDLHASRYIWHIRTSNGFLTSNAECLDEEGNSFGGYVSPDSKAPITTHFLVGPSFTNGLNELLMATHTAIGLDAVDAYVEDEVTSDVAFTGYAINQIISDISQLTAYISTFTVSEGSHSIVYASSDNASNVESFKSLSFFIDGTPPLSEIQVFGSSSTDSHGNLVLSTDNYISFISTDPVSNGVTSGIKEIRFSINNSAFAVFQGSFTLSEGYNRVEYYSIDNVGNAEAKHVFEAFVGEVPKTVVWTGRPSLC